jgi:hypothetical protein
MHNGFRLWLMTILLSVGSSNCAYADPNPEDRPEAPCDKLDLQATADGQTLNFLLTNQGDAAMNIEKDFSHWQNMYLVVLHEVRFGQTIPRTSYATDPLVGSYNLPAGGKILESIALTSGYPELPKLNGSLIIFWSTDIRASYRGGDCSVRRSGSLRVKAPIRISSLE